MAATDLSRRTQDQLRRRDSLPILPETYAPLLRMAGLTRTVAFIRRYGGTEARFPARPDPDHEMVQILGCRGVQEMRAEYGPLDLRWPSASDYLALLDARTFWQEGWSVHDIARKLYRDPKTIERYLKGVRDGGVRRVRAKTGPAPLPLFEWGR